MIVNGGTAICSEAAAVINQIAFINGFDARFIALEGHVISEIETNNGWALADPDHGIVFPVGYHELLTKDEEDIRGIITELLNDRGFIEGETIDWYFNALISTENNVVQTIGEAQSPRLYTLEKLAPLLAWLASLVAVFISFALLRGIRRAPNSKCVG